MSCQTTLAMVSFTRTDPPQPRPWAMYVHAEAAWHMAIAESAFVCKRWGVERMTHESRRRFIGRLTVGAPVLAAAGMAADTAMASEAGGGRRVVAGSPYATFSRAVVMDRTAFVSGVVGQKSSRSGTG